MPRAAPVTSATFSFLIAFMIRILAGVGGEQAVRR
jgi:hypothetical protein